jgi:hypothetical protein
MKARALAESSPKIPPALGLEVGSEELVLKLEGAHKAAQLPQPIEAFESSSLWKGQVTR